MTSRRGLVGCILALALFIALSCGGDAHVVTRFRMEGASMEPSYEHGQMVDVMGYENSSPQRGDVVVFVSPLNPDRTYLKRVIGIGGDVVQVQNERVTVNGDRLDEPYTRGRPTQCRPGLCGPWMVPDGEYFVMGDNRPNSSDSRQGWFVPLENVVGWVAE